MLDGVGTLRLLSRIAPLVMASQNCTVPKYNSVSVHQVPLVGGRQLGYELTHSLGELVHLGLLEQATEA